jgi:hypothetical protein
VEVFVNMKRTLIVVGVLIGIITMSIFAKNIAENKSQARNITKKETVNVELTKVLTGMNEGLMHNQMITEIKSQKDKIVIETTIDGSDVEEASKLAGQIMSDVIKINEQYIDVTSYFVEVKDKESVVLSGIQFENKK